MLKTSGNPVTDGLARDREVILFDNAGDSSTVPRRMRARQRKFDDWLQAERELEGGVIWLERAG
jgi:hypothetical protein